MKNKTYREGEYSSNSENYQRVKSPWATRRELVVCKKAKNPSFLSNMVLDLQLVDAIRVDAKPANCRHGFQ